MYVDKKPEVKAVIGIVNIAAHEYTDRSLATASWWDKYDVPEQTVYLLVKRYYLNGSGTDYVVFSEAATLTESYRESTLTSSVGAPGGGAWASSVDHKTDLNKPGTVHHSERIGYSGDVKRAAEYFKSVMERWGWFDVHVCL